MKQELIGFLVSQGLAVEQLFKKNFKDTQSNIERALEERGLSLNPKELAMAISELSPKGSRAALNLVIDWLQPFNIGLGLRVSHLTDEKIEVVLPYRLKTQNINKHLHEGAVITAAIEAATTLWQRHSLGGEFKINIREAKLSVLQTLNSEVRARAELSALEREDTLNHLRVQAVAKAPLQVRFYDENEQLKAEVDLVVHLTWVQTLAQPNKGQ